MRRSAVVTFAFVWGLALSSAAQPPPPAALADSAAIERGQQLLGEQCGFCHGANARGGSSGPDLTRSAMVQEDENGRQLGDFLRVGRPDRGMPRFDLTAQQTTDLAAFLHAQIYLAANRGLYKILDIVVGDAQAGEAFFNGAGQCRRCHSAGGDLKGIGAKYDPVALQGKIVLPRRGAAPGSPAYQDPNAMRATVTLPGGGTVTGAIVRLTDFDVTIYDAATRQVRSWLRNGDTPKVVVSDPLQAHMEMLTKWTDEQMHNVTAYLVNLK